MDDKSCLEDPYWFSVSKANVTAEDFLQINFRMIAPVRINKLFSNFTLLSLITQEFKMLILGSKDQGHISRLFRNLFSCNNFSLNQATICKLIIFITHHSNLTSVNVRVKVTAYDCVLI